jgi:hypothetical protein
MAKMAAGRGFDRSSKGKITNGGGRPAGSGRPPRTLAPDPGGPFGEWTFS